MAGKLDLDALESATGRLEEIVGARTADPGNVFVRDAAIQRFEFTYELAHKTLRRYLEQAAADPQAVERMSFPNLIRTASEQGLIRSDWERWSGWREARAKTSHTYHEDVAISVAGIVPDFLAEARHLLEQLKRRAAES
jgi:nucleotidyltransferase substrate binding protein (TIGR01987 family)